MIPTTPIPGAGQTDERAVLSEASKLLDVSGYPKQSREVLAIVMKMHTAALAAAGAPVQQQEPRPAIGDTGNEEADRIISRLMSSDPEFDDCADAASFIRRIVIEHKGPEGFGTWKDAAIAERVRRVKSEKKLTKQPALLQYRYRDVHPQTVTTGQYSEWETCDRAKYDEILHYRDNGYPHYEVRELYASAQSAQVLGAPSDEPMGEVFMLKREIHNLKQHIEGYCAAPVAEVVALRNLAKLNAKRLKSSEFGLLSRPDGEYVRFADVEALFAPDQTTGEKK